MRRLDIKPMKKLRGRARYERSFRRNMAWMAEWFPDAPNWTGSYDHWKLPIYEKVASVEHGSPEFRREVVETLVETAQAVSRNRPDDLGYARVAAMIDWPGLFGSEICVFFDPDYAASFDPATPKTYSRQDLDDGWMETRAPERDLFAELDVTLPEGFYGGGLAFERYDEDFDETYNWERWVAIEGHGG